MIKTKIDFVPEQAIAPAIIFSEKFEAWALKAKEKDTYRIIVSPDLQAPFEDREANNALEQYVADNQFDEWIDLGDFMDLDFLSTHNLGKHRLNAGKLLSQHYSYGREIVDRRLDVLHKNNKKATMTMIQGNHDYRAEAHIDKYPELEGTIEVELGLGLKERNVSWIRFWSDGTIYKVGKAAYCHGLYTSPNHAKKMVDNYCCNIFYGHNHDEQLFTKVMHGKNEVVVGHSLGCLCRQDQAYIGQNPKNWVQAFGDFFFRRDGLFTYYVPKIFNGQFTAPSGKTYKGRTR